MFFIFKKISKIKKQKKRVPQWKKHYVPAKKLVVDIIEQIHFKNQDKEIFQFNRISIRNQKTRWGSCSSNKNLNFNYKIVFLPYELAEYLVVHELCHLIHFNHSKDFWNLVENYCPDYRIHQKILRNYQVIKKVEITVS